MVHVKEGKVTDRTPLSRLVMCTGRMLWGDFGLGRFEEGRIYSVDDPRVIAHPEAFSPLRLWLASDQGGG